MGFILFWAAWLLHLIIRVAFCWYKPIFFFSRYGFKGGFYEWNRHNLSQAMAEDQSANVALYPMLNKFFTRGEATWDYGDEDDTISYCSSMAYHKSPNSSPAKGLVKFLMFVDKGHDTKSINGKITRDLEALARLEQAGIVSTTRLIDVKPDLEDDSWKLYVANVTSKKRELIL